MDRYSPPAAPPISVDDVYAHVSEVCFRTGPPGVVGAETEWLVTDRHRPGAHVPLTRLRSLIGDGPLPGEGRITYEPGGQLEISSPPRTGPAAACRSMAADLAAVGGRLSGTGLTLEGHGVDPLREPLLQATEERYRCMSAFFEKRSADGAYGGLGMMCTTASVQVCVDIGADSADAAARWGLAHRLGPVLVAAFANSPVRAGRRTGLKSSRQAIWSALDPGRTGRPHGADPAAAWARYALDAEVMMVREPDGRWRGDPGVTFAGWIATGSPTQADLDYHLSTLFPPVRPRGWLELRMIDALPGGDWRVPVALVAALLDDPQAADEAAAALEELEGDGGLWLTAATCALEDAALAKAARRCFAAAGPALVRLGAAELVPALDDYRDRYVEAGRCPADDTLEETPWTAGRTPDTTAGSTAGSTAGTRSRSGSPAS